MIDKYALVKESLEEALERNKSHIGLVGSIGSKSGNDIDMLFIPSRETSKYQFFSSQLELVTDVSQIIEEKGATLIYFPLLIMQDEVMHLTKDFNNPIYLHRLEFISEDKLLGIPPKWFLDSLSNLDTYFGDIDNLSLKGVAEEDDFYWFLTSNSYNPSYPQELNSQKVSHISNYVLHNLGLEEKKAVTNTLTSSECQAKVLKTFRALDEIQRAS